MLEMFLKESENDSIVEDLYIARDVSNAKYSIEEKKKYLEEAIRNGGYYGDNGCWNSIMTFPNDKNVYRGRVETLIIKDDKYIFLKFLPRDSQNYKRTYTVPGGSFELNIPNDIQAINECMEEARIKISNIQASGITYKELKDPPKWAIEKQPVNWNGNYTEVYVGEYDGKYTGHIDKVDEDKFMITGKFYKLDEIFKYLKKEHKEALKVIYPNRFNSGKFVKESVNERNNVSVKQIKGVIKKIRAKVDKDKKPPTGNQNCMLCTWCAEAWFRGYDILPRPIYSPTDKVFDFEGYEIIKSPTKISIKDKNEIKKIISVAGDGSRFYTHMKWKNGNGGHEFILININNDIYVLDAQQGLLENVESSEGSTYFKEVDYSKSYIIRMDNKEFNKPMFKYNNDLYIKDFTEEDKKYVNEYMTESVIFNEKDIYYNKDKFDSGEINLCFITGFSGSGKSTMADEMEKSGIEKYELDDIVFQFNFSDENLKEYGGMISSFFNGPGKKYRAVKGIDDLKTDKEADDYQANICIDFIDYAKKYASSHKDKKFIVEGVEIFGAYIDKIESLKDYAIYIKGTSLFNSYIRSAKRDSQDAETDFGKFKSFIKMIVSTSRFKQYLISNTRLNKIKKQINGYVTESEDKSELTKDFKSKISNIQYKTLSIDKPEIYDYLKNHFSKNNPMWEGVKDSKTYMDCFINGNNSRHIKRVGEVLINKANDEVIGFEVVEKPNNYLAIEIPDKKYRDYGFGKILLEDAIKKHGCYQLYVAKDNKVAIKMYKTAGFKIIKDRFDGQYWLMRLSYPKNITESTLSSKDRNSLPNSTFGIPSQRKFPLNDKAHVLAAIRMFNRVDREHEKELAHNIIKAMDKYGIKSDMVGKKNRLQTYLSDEDY